MTRLRPRGGEWAYHRRLLCLLMTVVVVDDSDLEP